jgi:hypothetical protein
VDASTLARASSQNGVHWITDLTATDGRWNWQVVKFRVPPASLPTVARLQPAWYGHGEPTPAYPTTLYLWNRHTASWEQMQSLNGAGSDVWLSKQVTINSISNDFCLACHGAAPPPNVYFPTPLVNVSSSWASGDRHGASAGGGWSSSLRTPYVRGQDAIPCETCHDPHGNANLYHIQTSVNATTVSAPDNPSVKNLCLACHVGPVDTIHAQCISCHVGDGDEHGSPPSSFEGSWCLSCHSHGAAWGHYDPGCHGCGDPYWYGSPSF